MSQLTEMIPYREMALHNFNQLSKNSYPGRGGVVGVDTKTANPYDNNLIEIYWLMGRQPSSRNRRFKEQGTGVLIEQIDTSQPADPLTIYTPFAHFGLHNIFSNGSQTDTIYNGIANGERALSKILQETTYEPDTSATSRIAAVSSLRTEGPFLKMAVLSKASRSDDCNRNYFHFHKPMPGFGYCIHTYVGDTKPLQPFIEEPFLLPIFLGGIVSIRDMYWAALNPENRVALAVRQTEPNGQMTITAINAL